MNHYRLFRDEAPAPVNGTIFQDCFGLDFTARKTESPGFQALFKSLRKVRHDHGFRWHNYQEWRSGFYGGKIAGKPPATARHPERC